MDNPPPSVTQNKQYSDIRLVYEYTKSRSPKTVSDRVPPLSPRRFRRVVDDAIERARGRARRRPRAARAARVMRKNLSHPSTRHHPPSRLARARAREIDARGRPPRAHAPSSVRAAPPSARRPSVRARDATARSPNSRTVSASARAVRRPRARASPTSPRVRMSPRAATATCRASAILARKRFPILQRVFAHRCVFIPYRHPRRSRATLSGREIFLTFRVSFCASCRVVTRDPGGTRDRPRRYLTWIVYECAVEEGDR